MANINELNLGQESLGLDYENMPEERGEYVSPVQPGTYVFELPEDLSSIWEVIQRQGKERVQAVLHGDNALTVHLPKNEDRAFSAWINNHPFPRGKEGIEVSDMQYLIRILEPSATPNTNPQFVDVFSRHGGKKFKANVTWAAYCNPEKDAYFENAETKAIEVAEGTRGCGENYYQKSIPRDENDLYVDQFQCDKCHAVVKAFPRLRKFSSLED